MHNLARPVTKDAARLLYALYGDYKQGRKNGEDEEYSRIMGHAQIIRDKHMQNEIIEDVSTWCFELKRAGFLLIANGSNIAYRNTLTESAIMFMEQRAWENVNVFLDFMGKIK